MSILSQVFGLALNLISLPFSIPASGDGKSDMSFFPFDTLRNMQAPCTSLLFQMGENELKLSALPRGYCSNCCPAKVQRDIRFVLYTRANANKGIMIEKLEPGEIRRAGADSRLPTIMYIHGFSESSPGLSGRAILNAYMKKNQKYNLIFVDWSELSTFPWYQTAVKNGKYVAEALRQFIEIYHDSGEIPIGNIHVIGFSLGAHIAGVAGKRLRRGLRIPRITGLDPALPEFSMNDTSKRLTRSDAEYVDVIHTDSGIFGFPEPIGHADFFPNGGRALQPGCQPSYLAQQRIINQVLACSHVRAWHLYAESVKNEEAFPATKCTNWRGPNKQCNFSIDGYMGYHSTRRSRGAYYLTTHQEKPYGIRSATDNYV